MRTNIEFLLWHDLARGNVYTTHTVKEKDGRCTERKLFGVSTNVCVPQRTGSRGWVPRRRRITKSSVFLMEPIDVKIREETGDDEGEDEFPEDRL